MRLSQTLEMFFDPLLSPIAAVSILATATLDKSNWPTTHEYRQFDVPQRHSTQQTAFARSLVKNTQTTHFS
jgi:hypothetical protein